MYNNNSGFSTNFKVGIFVQSLVFNYKVIALKSTTILIPTISIFLIRFKF